MKKTAASKLHKIFGLLLCPILILIALSGIGLNHPELIKNISLPLESLPENYHFQNWNNGAIQALAPEPHSGKIYAGGKNGIGYFEGKNFTKIKNPLAQNAYQNFVYSLLLEHENQRLWVGTRDGLFSYSLSQKRWDYFAQTTAKRIVSLVDNGDKILAVSNHHIFQIDSAQKLQYFPIKMQKSQRQTPLYKLIFELHSGEVLGIVGILLMDLLALALIYFCLSGLYQWFFPKVVRRNWLNHEAKIKGGKTFRWLAKNHNRWGLILLPLLIISAGTGLFMRPPALLLIAFSDSPITLKESHATSEIPYKITKAAIFSGDLFLLTDNGAFAGKPSAGAVFAPTQLAVPVHAMGATVFQQHSQNQMLIGSFSGLYFWQPSNNTIEKINTGGKSYQNMPTAALSQNDDVIAFDFYRGKLLDENSTLASQPQNFIASARMGLWNLLFELHNLRLFEHYIGAFYLLVLMLTAIFLLVISITGAWIYIPQLITKYKRKKAQ